MSGDSTLDLVLIALKFLIINLFRFNKIAGTFWNGFYEKSNPVTVAEKVAKHIKSNRFWTMCLTFIEFSNSEGCGQN
jgi:hypothetical protein